MEEIWFIESGRKRRGKKVICQQCEKEFVDRIKGNKKCCSHKCSSLLRRTRQKCKCDYCKSYFERAPSKCKTDLLFCSRECKEKAQADFSNSKFDSIRPDHYNNGKCWSAVKRKFIVSSEKECCCDCGEDTNYLLVVHHKDRNSKNNDHDNLEIVCHNCHAKRHLFLNKKGEWNFCPRYLTPRDKLKDL